MAGIASLKRRWHYGWAIFALTFANLIVEGGVKNVVPVVFVEDGFPVAPFLKDPEQCQRTRMATTGLLGSRPPPYTMPLPSDRSIIARQVGITRAITVVPYLTPEEVRQLENTALDSPRTGETNALLVRVMFQTGLRISEALGLTPVHMEIFEGRPAFRFVGEGKKPWRVACPVTLMEPKGRK